MLKNQKVLAPKPPPGRLVCPKTITALPKPSVKIRIRPISIQDEVTFVRLTAEPFGKVIKSKFGLDGRPRCLVKVFFHDREANGRYPEGELLLWFFLERSPDLLIDDSEPFGVVGKI